MFGVPTQAVQRAVEARALLVIGQGGLGDQSYNDLGHLGFERAVQRAGVVGRTVETDDVVSEGADILRTAAQGGFGLIVDLEYSHGPTFEEVAPLFPRTHFVILNQIVQGANVTPILFREQEGSYLAGVLAAESIELHVLPGLGRSRDLGLIGGTKSLGIDKFVVGFIEGVRSVDPALHVRVAYADSFGDPAVGLEMAKAMYGAGIGIIYAVAGTTGVGVIAAARETGRYAIGVDTDQDALAPGHVLTSMVKHTDVAVEHAVADWHDQSLRGGTIFLGLKQGAVGLSSMRYTRAMLSGPVLDAVQAARARIEAGQVRVWDVTSQGYPSYFR